MMSIAFLAWVTPEEASTYYSSFHKKLEDEKDQDIKRKTWKQYMYALYQESKETLVNWMCSQSGLLASGKKHELVECLSQKNTEFDLHYGKIGSIPNSTAGMMRLSVAQLRTILRKHQILHLGTKEELIMRVWLLKAGYLEGAFSREHLCILHSHDRGGDDNQVNTRGAQQYSVNLFVAQENTLMGRKIPSQPGHHASKSLFHLFTLKTDSGV